jgi:chromosome segregation protein
LTELEQSQTNSQWQQIQATIRTQEQQLQQRIEALRNAQQQLKDLENQLQRLQEKITVMSAAIAGASTAGDRN